MGIKMKTKKYYLIISAFILFVTKVCANGLMMPTNTSYPKDFLRNTVTEVTVNINGLIAETTVYQEFLNESDITTNVVYSFPLPANARATEFIYWYKGKAYKAVLKVKEQATNPGTGEGGVAAEVNTYIGSNGIKIFLENVEPGMIQKVELHYINLCDYYLGNCTYTFPLNTSQFVTYPLDDLQFNVSINSNTVISGYELPNNPSFKILNSNGKNLGLEVSTPKAYLNNDFILKYETEQSTVGLDFYSAANDSLDGHFALLVRPQNEAVADSVFSKKVIFLISNAYSMYGANLEQSVNAISQSLDMLTSKDYFNIFVFNYTYQTWKSNPVPATATNISNAKSFLNLITSSYGSDLNSTLKAAINQFTNDSFSNSILIFTDGRAILDPKQIETVNNYHIGIFPIGIGSNLDREKLEMLAELNYGFVTYLNSSDNLSEEMFKVFNQISQPILKDVAFEYGGAGVYDVIPSKPRSTYAGSSFFMAGRYKTSGESVVSLAGKSVKGITAYDFHLNFNNATDKYKFVEPLWAKEMIDNIEREIEVYGETDSLKQKDIELSLMYGIRCKYTAYIADYQTPAADVEDIKNNSLGLPTSFLMGNYPNPFNPSTRIRFFLDANAGGKVKFVKIYNILGQLVMVIDITHLSSGWNEVVFNGKDIYGRLLPSGIYIVRLEVENKICNTLKINLIK
jgi:Ca-activated chloride channel homolog